MSYFEKSGMYVINSPSMDAFDRLRVSNPHTIFDSKQLYDKSPLFWSESITTGSGAPTSTHSKTDASVTMSVTGNGDAIVRQTFMRFNYQPGKSTLVFMTTSLTDTSNVKARVGMFSGDASATAPSGSNGLFFESDSGTLYVVKRKNGTDTRVAQSSWNLDKADGTGASGFNIDPKKVQIIVIDFEWLGVGRVRIGFVVNGLIVYCHEFNHANIDTTVYMSTPNLPLRYEISSTGGSSTLQHICSSVISEGGIQQNGLIRSATTGSSHVDGDTAGTIYSIIGVQLKTTHLDASIDILRASLVNATADNFDWMLIANPTIAGSPSWADETNSAVQTFIGVVTTTITGGTIIQAGQVKSSGSSGFIDVDLHTSRRVGAAVDGTRGTMVLAARPHSNGADFYATLSWRELF